jgi:hypothetical protein
MTHVLAIKATPPSTFTFVEALGVTLGALIVVSSYLLAKRSFTRDEAVGVVGNCIVGIGTSVVFAGVAEGSTSGQFAWIG